MKINKEMLDLDHTLRPNGTDRHMRGAPKPLELSSGGRAPCGTSCLYSVSVLGPHLYHCTSWWWCKRLCLASVIFFFKILSTHLSISWWMIYEHTCPYHAEYLAVFDKKTGMIPVPHPPNSPDLALSNFFVCFPGWKTSSNVLQMWKR